MRSDVKEFNLLLLDLQSNPLLLLYSAPCSTTELYASTFSMLNLLFYVLNTVHRSLEKIRQNLPFR